MVLEVLVQELEPSELIVSTYGIREGLLYSTLKPSIRKLDPLIDAALTLDAALDRLVELTAKLAPT